MDDPAPPLAQESNEARQLGDPGGAADQRGEAAIVDQAGNADAIALQLLGLGDEAGAVVDDEHQKLDIEPGRTLSCHELEQMVLGT
jgi:hypothetical protein